jgi:hypothetical protein
VTYKSVPGWSPGSDSSGLKVPDIIFGIRIEIHMLSCMSIYRFVSARISILVSKIIYCTWRSLEADLYLAGLQDQRPATSRYNILFLTQELKS